MVREALLIAVATLSSCSATPNADPRANDSPDRHAEQYRVAPSDADDRYLVVSYVLPLRDPQPAGQFIAWDNGRDWRRAYALTNRWSPSPSVWEAVAYTLAFLGSAALGQGVPYAEPYPGWSSPRTSDRGARLTLGD